MKACFIRMALAASAALICIPAFAAAPASHASFTPQTSSDTCFACHGTKAGIAKKTASLSPNPHDSHRGFVPCMECHAFAKDAKPVLMCNDCHAFETRDGFHIISRPAK